MIEDMFAEGEQVAMRLTFRGTNTGDILTSTPLPATGKQVTMREILIVRIASGKVVELWSEADYLGGY